MEMKTYLMVAFSLLAFPELSDGVIIPPEPPVQPDCLFGTYYKDVDQVPSCDPAIPSCPKGYFCEVAPNQTLGHCCLKRNPCEVGYPWTENGQAIHCMGENARICPKGYMCTGSITSFSACCPVPKCPKKYPDQNCQGNLCKVDRCSTIPDAQCVMNTCGECKARWYTFNKKYAIDVTKQCKAAPQCAEGETPTLCIIPACSSVPCTNTKWTACLEYNCDGCHAYYFYNLREVTPLC